MAFQEKQIRHSWLAESPQVWRTAPDHLDGSGPGGAVMRGQIVSASFV